MSEIKVEQIVIKIGEKEILLNVDEAKELRKVLDDLFGDKVTTIINYPQYPYWYGKWEISAPQYGTIMCLTGNVK